MLFDLMKIIIRYINVSSKNVFFYKYNYLEKVLILQNKKGIVKSIDVSKS